MRKKLFTFFLALLASSGFLFAQSSGTCGANLVWTLDEQGTLTIFGTGEMTNYVDNVEHTIKPRPWSYENVIKVIIEEGCTSIGEYAFYECTSLASVTIPNSVKSIGYGAFSGCSGLTSIEIPNSVTSIGNYAFSDCAGLTSVTIPNSVTNIGNKAFSDCTGLTFVTIPNSVKSIGEGAFYGCNGLTSVTIPNSVTNIGNNAFSDCTGLTSIEIPNSVTSIGEWAFAHCTGLTSVTIPNSVTSIGRSAFDSCTSLTSVTIPNSVTSIGKYAFSDCTGLTSVTIGNSVTSIGDDAFSKCTGLTSVTIESDAIVSKAYLINIFGSQVTEYIIGDEVKSIGNSAFYGCSGLTSVTIPNSVTSIGKYAFEGCSGLTSITIPNNVTSIGYEAFYSCSGLTSVTIPNSVTSIGGQAFEDCVGLTTVTIPNSVTSIGDDAFSLVPNIAYNGTATGSPWGARSVNGYVEGNLVYSDETKTNLLACFSTAIGDIDIPESVTSIGNHAFYECTSLASVTIPNSVTSIGSSAFYGCSGLTSVTIPNSVTSIERQAFYYCPSLTSITIPNSVTSIGVQAFYVCTGLTSVTIPNSVTSIGVQAFYGCTGLTSVTIPNSVTSIGESAFSGCTGLTSVTIPNSVTNIRNDAFYLVPNIIYNGAATGSPWGARSVNGYVESNLVYSDAAKTNLLACSSAANGDIVIPNTVKSIGVAAFSGCSGLTSVTIPNSVMIIGHEAFKYCSGLTSIVIPESVKSIGAETFWYAKYSVYFLGTEPPQMGTNCLKGVTCYIPCGTSAAYENKGKDSYGNTYKFKENEDYFEFNNTLTEDFNKLMIDNPDVWTYSDKYGAYGKKQGGATGYLMTPPVNILDYYFLSDRELRLYFSHTHRYATAPFENEMSLWVTADYKGSFESSEWNQLTINKYASNNDWNFVGCSVNVPKSYVGHNTVFAFKYTSTASNYATWEIKNISLETICDDGIPDTYNITFKDWDGTILQSTQVEEGSLPQYNGDTPTRPEDDLYTYSFSGWSPAIVAATADAIYTATYTENHKGATPVETEKVAVTPYENTADIVWPSVSGAATYELVIRNESGNVICKLVFNAQGYLTSIAFQAPSKDRTPQKQQFAGFEFTITGLDEGTNYSFELIAKDSDGTIINSESGVFTTLGEQQAIDNTPFPSGEGLGEASKLLRDGKMYIIRGEKVYNAQGALVK